MPCGCVNSILVPSTVDGQLRWRYLIYLLFPLLCLCDSPYTGGLRNLIVLFDERNAPFFLSEKGIYPSCVKAPCGLPNRRMSHFTTFAISFVHLSLLVKCDNA